MYRNISYFSIHLGLTIQFVAVGEREPFRRTPASLTSAPRYDMHQKILLRTFTYLINSRSYSYTCPDTFLDTSVPCAYSFRIPVYSRLRELGRNVCGVEVGQVKRSIESNSSQRKAKRKGHSEIDTQE